MIGLRGDRMYASDIEEVNLSQILVEIQRDPAEISQERLGPIGQPGRGSQVDGLQAPGTFRPRVVNSQLTVVSALIQVFLVPNALRREWNRAAPLRTLYI